MSFTPFIKLTGHNSSVYGLIDGNADVFYSCGGEGYIVEWQKSGKEENGLLLAQCDNAVYCGCHISEYNLLVAGTMHGTVVWVDIAAKQTLHVSLAHTKAVYDIKIWNNQVLSCGGDGKLIWHDLISNTPMLILQVSNSALRCMCLDEAQGLIYVGSSDAHTYVIDANAKKVIARYRMHDSSIFALLLTNGVLYSGSRDAKMKLWRASNMELIKSIDAHKSTINSLALMDDLIVSASKDKSVKIWTKEGKLVQSIYAVEGGHINSVNKVIALDNERFATASDDRSIILFGMDIG